MTTADPALGQSLVVLRSAARALRDQLAGGSADEPDAAAIAQRLADSVLRPLDELGGQDAQGAAASSSAVPTLWDLAEQATSLRCGGDDAPPQLLEATAALQDLAIGSRQASDEIADERSALLRELQRDLTPAIEPAPDGPYLVTNAENLVDHLGCALPSRPQMALCRCGRSAMKPYCDGSHARVGFTDEKSPDRVTDRRDRYVGQQVTILDNRGICQHSGFCTDRLATVFRLGEEPFVHPSGGRMDEIVRAVRDCPSGALGYAIDGVEARGDVDYHGKREPTIEVTKDGPYRVTGGLPLREPDGQPVPRAEGASLEHYALCRCGQSQNKPFCSGMHWYVEFRDPIPEPGRTPTMFEWAGGLPALQRMMRFFYETHVPQDPLLAPVFADMSADHPERVAKWLAEVFGGPPFYSEEYGGYPRMLSQHVGRCITEEWRARWVELLMRSARDAGLPNDAEFRSAFQAYVEWGSRLAVENSQTAAKPPAHMPMPRWDWNTGAGAPTVRISALAETSEQAEEPVVLPAADEPVRFEKHIRGLFRERDRTSMKFAFDLWAYDDVREHAAAILGRLRDGTMPCDGTWPAERVDVFERWTDADCPA